MSAMGVDYMCRLALCGIFLTFPANIFTQNVVRIRHNDFHCFGERPKIDNGYYEVLRTDGHIIRAHCDEGFLLAGNSLRICEESEKQFSGHDPWCEDIDECLLLGNRTGSDEGSADGHISEEDDSPVPCHRLAFCINTLGSYECRCREGYSGNGYECHETTNLKTEDNEIRTHCNIPQPPKYGYLVQKSPDWIIFHCHPGNIIQGNPNIQCVNGSWSNPVPGCVQGLKACSDPGIPNNGYRIGNRFNAGGVLRFYCRNGFLLMGPRFRICQENGWLWTSYQPQCVSQLDYTSANHVDESASDNDESMVVENVSSVFEDVNSEDEDEDEDESIIVTLRPDVVFTKPSNTSAVKSINSSLITNSIPESAVQEGSPVSLGEAENGVSDVLCGEVFTDKNGEVSWPWLVEITSSSEKPVHCNGVMVCPSWVLTAGRCIHASRNEIIKLLRPHELRVLVQGTERRVIKIVRHSRYFLGHHGNNIALLRISEEPNEQKASAVCLPEKSDVPPDGEAWDRNANRRTLVNIQNSTMCSTSGDEICTNTRSELGTPLVAPVGTNNEPDRLRLVGLSTREDTSYANITAYVTWIRQLTEACSL